MNTAGADVTASDGAEGRIRRRRPDHRVQALYGDADAIDVEQPQVVLARVALVTGRESADRSPAVGLHVFVSAPPPH